MKRVLTMTLGLALLAACDRAAPPQGLTTKVTVPVARPRFAQGDLRLTVAHTGTRRLEHPQVSGVAGAYRERISTDGHGRFAIEPLEAHLATPSEWSEFELTQRIRQGFLFRYRDFLVRDASLFERNWSTTDLRQTESVAGRLCDVYRVERNGGQATVFELALDQETGLVLASREFGADGRLVADMAYESFSLDPDLGSVAWHQASNVENVHPSVEAIEAEARSPVLRPRLLPDGYAALELATVQDGRGTTWLKHTFSDGVEPLFFLQALEEPTRQFESSAGGMTGEIVPGASSVMVFALGGATAIQGRVEGFHLLAIGKVPEAGLLDLIESSLP